MGPRHVPLNAAFMNGTVEGDDVWIPMSSVLGGQERCGFGWNMFVECLAGGRGVSLPAGSVGDPSSSLPGCCPGSAAPSCLLLVEIMPDPKRAKVKGPMLRG